MYFPTIASFLSTIPFPVTPGEFIIGGYFSPGDGGGGTFIWVPIIPGGSIMPPPEDLGIIFYHPSDTTPSPGYNGYFKRIYSGPVNVRWFGAIMGGGGSITDVTPYFDAARDSAFTKDGTIYFPE